MHHGAAPLGNVNVQLGTIGGGSIPKSNAQRIEELERRLIELERWQHHANELFIQIGRVFSINLA